VYPPLRPLHDRCAFFVRGYFYLFLRGEHTVRYYRPRNDAAQPESGVGEGREGGRRRWRWREVGRNGEERHGATENIYVRAVDKITANLHARRLAFAKLSFPLNRWVLLLPTDNPAGRVDRFAGSSLYYRGLWRCIEMHETCTPRRARNRRRFPIKVARTLAWCRCSGVDAGSRDSSGSFFGVGTLSFPVHRFVRPPRRPICPSSSRSRSSIFVYS